MTQQYLSPYIDVAGRAREVLGYPHRGSVSPSRSV